MSSKVGIVYFSKDGSTRVLANQLAKTHKATVIELVAKSKKGNMITNSLSAVRKKSVELEGDPQKRINDFDLIYLCTPIWASNGTPAMNGFIQSADFSGKEVIVVTVKGFSVSEEPTDTHVYLSDRVKARNGDVVKCIDIHGAGIGKTASEAHIAQQIKNL